MQDIELVGVRGPDGADDLIAPITVKIEPSTDDSGVGLSVDGAPIAEGEAANILVLKKKARKRRASTTDEDLPPPPPPMKTIRLEHVLLPEDGGETLEWNILEDAQRRGMVEVWLTPEEKEAAAQAANEHADVLGNGIPASEDNILGSIFGGQGENEETPEEIARRLEEKYDKPAAKKSKKLKPKVNGFCLRLGAM